MKPPVVLDTDGSVGSLPGEQRIALRDRQESLRYSATRSTMRALGTELQRRLPPPAQQGTVFIGSGDFHHLSWPLIARCATACQAALRVLVFDNHPDNMRYPFGVHCGSWVARVAALPGVAQVDVVGITSADIGCTQAWQNRIAPLRRGRLRYWSVGVDTSWSRWLGLSAAFRSFDGLPALLDALSEDLAADARPLYVSIDKDVFSPALVRTNWDQGLLDEAGLQRALAAVRGPLAGSDVTGEVSVYRYRSAFKRWLSGLDAQDHSLDATTVASWQAEQHALNLRLLGALAVCGAGVA